MVLSRPPVSSDESESRIYDEALEREAQRAQVRHRLRALSQDLETSRVLRILDTSSLRLIRLASQGNLNSEYARGLREAMGYRDYFPSAVNRGLPFEAPFTLGRTFPQNSANERFASTLAVPDLNVGRCFALAYTLPRPVARDAATWCGVRIAVPHNIHDDLRGAKDVTVTAGGRIDYDYQLSCEPGPHWNSVVRAANEGAAWMQVVVRADLIAYDLSTGVLLVGADGGFPAFLSGRTIANTRLFPNGTSMAATGQGETLFNGPYAGFIGATSNAALTLKHGVARHLRTDRLYEIVVSCFVSSHAHVGTRSDGNSIASANVSATLSLSRVSLHIGPHEVGVF